MRFPFAWALATLVASLTAATAGITPTARPSQDDDLKVGGAFAALAPGATGYLSRAALLALPGVARIHEAPAPSVKPGDLAVLTLDRLVDALPVAGNADALMFRGNDRWISIVPLDFLRRVHPYLMLTYNGNTPAQGWPKFGPFEPLAPYFCGLSPALGPIVPVRMEYGEFDASQIIEIDAVNIAEHYAPFYAGPLAHLAPAADAGRRLFIAECNNCHQGPAQTGGNTSQRPFVLLQIHATSNVEFFRKFVRNPKMVYPNTVMPSHEYFTDPMMDHLIAFLAAAHAAGLN